MKLSIVIATICSASLGLAGVAQPRQQTCDLSVCPSRCTKANMTFKESDCWGVSILCVCTDKNGVEYQVTA